MKGERRSTAKITLRLRPEVVKDLKEMAEKRWGVTLSDVVSAGVEALKTDPLANGFVVMMQGLRIESTGHKAFPRKSKKKKRR